jgi:hypothetical protein
MVSFSGTIILRGSNGSVPKMRTKNSRNKKKTLKISLMLRFLLEEKNHKLFKIQLIKSIHNSAEATGYKPRNNRVPISTLKELKQIVIN